MRTVVLVPYRPNPQRDPVWGFVKSWITRHYNYPLFVADCDGDPFSIAQARNKAALDAGDWDVAVIHDADTIAHPEAVQRAVAEASASMRQVFTCDSHMYCDRSSSQRIMDSGWPMFPRPDFTDRGAYQKPSGGIFAVSRKLFDAVGGYVESLVAYGYEDLVFLQCCGVFGEGHGYIPGHINLHLWHPPSTQSMDSRFNEQVWQTMTEHRIRRDQIGARHYLSTLGHTVP